ncbi:hypothetical protein [Bacillus thuringiensis]|nr:hypothetical protein [Bacillus thuringiensis]
MQLDGSIIIASLKTKLADALVDSAMKDARIHQLEQELKAKTEVAE